MPWVYIDDHFDEHEKVLRAGGDAAWLFVCGLCYVNRTLTGGKILAAVVPRLTDRRQPMKLAARLVDVGLWERTDDGFKVHDYEFWNRSAEAKREKARNAAKARWDKRPDAPSTPPGNASSIATASLEHMPHDALREGLPLPRSPNPSSSSVSDLRAPPPGREEELLLRREAEKRLAKREAELGKVNGREAWLRKAEAGIRAERAQERAHELELAAKWGETLARCGRSGAELLAAVRDRYGEDRERRLATLRAVRAMRRRLVAA